MMRDQNDNLRLYVVYDNPRDMPGHIVIRGCAVLPTGALAFDAKAIGWRFGEAHRTHEEALEAARGHCERLGLVRLERHPDDHPTIVETWI